MNSELHETILDHAGRVGRNAAILMVGNVLFLAIGIAYIMLLGRLLGPESYGVYAGAVATAAMAAILMNQGIGYFVTRESAKGDESDSALIAESSTLVMLTFVSSLVLMLPFSVLAPVAAMRQAICVAVVVVWGRAAIRVYAGFLEGKQRMVWSAAGSVIMSAVPLAGATLLLIPSLRSPTTALLCEIAGIGLAMFILQRVIFKSVGLKTPPRKDTLRFIKKALPFWGINAAGVVVLQFDVLMLSWTRTTGEAGLYRAAMNVVMFSELLPAMIAAALYPALSKLIESEEMLGSSIRRALKNCAALGVAASLGIAALSGPIIQILYGSQFSGADDCLRRLAPLAAIKFPAYVLIFLLFVREKEWRLLPFAIAACAANVIINSIFIAHYGISAAITATMTSNGILLLFLLYLVAGKMVNLSLLPLAARLAFSAIAALGCLWATQSFNAWLHAVAGLAGFAAAAALCGLIDKWDYAAALRVARIGKRDRQNADEAGR